MATAKKKLAKLVNIPPMNSTTARAKMEPDGGAMPIIFPRAYHAASKSGMAEIPDMTSQAATTRKKQLANLPRTKRHDSPIAVEPIIGWMALRTMAKPQRIRIQTKATTNGANMMHAIMTENADAEPPTCVSGAEDATITTMTSAMITKKPSAISAIQRNNPVAIMRPQASTILSPAGRRWPAHLKNALSMAIATAARPIVRPSTAPITFSNLTLARFSAPLDAVEYQ